MTPTDVLAEVRGAIAPTTKDYREAGLLPNVQVQEHVPQLDLQEQSSAALEDYQRGSVESAGLRTSLNNTLIDEYKQVQEQVDEAARADRAYIQDMGFVERVKHIAAGTTTGYIASGIAQSLVQDAITEFDSPEMREPVDAKFINDLFFEHGLPYNPKYEEQLRKASSKQEALQTFYRLQDHAESARIALNSPLTNFAVQALDPAENLALVGATLVTGGLGAPAALSARSLSLFGKVTRTTKAAGATTAVEALSAGGVRAVGWTRAGAQAGAISGAMLAGSEAGRETSFVDYVTAGALVTAGRYYFGPERQLVKRGLAKTTDAQAIAELGVPSPQVVQPVAPVQFTKFTPIDNLHNRRLRAQREAESIPTPTKPTRAQALQDAALTPELRAEAAKAPFAKRALPALRERVRVARDATKTLHDLKQVRQSMQPPTRKSLPKRLPKGTSARVAVQRARRDWQAEVDALDARIAELEGTASTLQRAERAVQGAERAVKAGEHVERIRSGKFTQAERAAGNQLYKERVDAYTAEAHAAAAARRAALADVQPLDADSILRLEAIEHNSLPSMMREEVNLPVTGSSAMEGSGRLKVPMQAFRGLVSEFEKITLGSPAVRSLIGLLLDDPLMRTGFRGRNAASYLRMYRNILHGHLQKWETALDDYVRTLTGDSKVQSLFGFSSKHEAKRLEVERDIAEHLLQRNEAARLGDPIPTHPDEGIRNLVDIYEAANAATLDIAKRAGLEGAESVQIMAGYFHRSYSYDKLRHITNRYGDDIVKQLLTQSAMSGLGVEAKYAEQIADAIFTRTVNKGTSARHDFMGQLGKMETASILDTLKAEGVSKEVYDHIRGRLTQRTDAATGAKYLQDRLPLDMQAQVLAPDGTRISMTDLIDMDISRLLENTMHGLAGRSALAKVGIGGTDSAIERYRQQVLAELNKSGASTKQIQDANKQLDYVFGDFTGMRPDDAILTEGYSTTMSLASASMLGSTGLLQIAETAIIANRYGMVNTMQAIFSRTPIVKDILRSLGANKDLADEFRQVVGIDLSRDMRVRSWKRQVEVGQTATAWHNRIAYMMQQATPTITGQRMVHKAQANMVINLGLHKVIRAANGSAEDLAEIVRYMPELDGATLLGEVKGAVRTNRLGAVTDFGWSQLSEQALEDLMNVVTRMADDALLHGRVGQGASFTRSAVGQVLFQFMSYSSYAHNKLLRGTLHNKGAIGVASLFVHQYPLMFTMTYLNEVRRGEVPDLDNDADLMRVATRALSYSAALGLFDLGFSVVGGGRGGVSAMDVLGSGGSLFQIPNAIADGEAMRAVGLGADAVAGMTFLGAIPGAQAAIKAAKE